MASNTAESAPLPQALAYGIILGFGIVFALFINLVTYLNRRFLNELKDAETLMTAKKTVKTGLIASAVVSSWCYSATLLNSVRLTYINGLSSLWWFAAGCSFQIVAYSIVAIELKRRAPRADTILEAVRIRFGNAAHIVFFIYGVLTQIQVSSSLLLGASGALETMCGSNAIAMHYLIPVGIIIYTLLGGLKSTFLSDYFHTVTIFIILLIFMFKVMTGNQIPVLGSPGNLWDLLQDAALENPSSGKHGSYLTMTNGQALLLAAVVLVTGFSCVFVDPSYGQKAIAARPSAVVRGYFFGAACWFAIPVGLSATMGFVAIGLQTTKGAPYWPVKGGATKYQIDNALILPYAAEAVTGVGGSVAVIIMVFMAVTSAFSAEIIAHASIVTFDIYRPYVNPRATDGQLKLVSYIAMLGFSIFISSLSTGLKLSEISIGWLLEFPGVVFGSQVFPISLALTSDHVSPIYAAIAGPVGTICGLCSWLGTTKALYGKITVATTFENWPMFTGSIIGIFTPLILWLLWYPFVKAYNWEDLFVMKAVQPRSDDREYNPEDRSDLGGWDMKEMTKASYMAKIFTFLLFSIFMAIVPFSLYGTGYIFSRNFFLGWTIWVFIWSGCSALYICIAPIWEARKSIIRVIKGVFGGLVIDMENELEMDEIRTNTMDDKQDNPRMHTTV